MRLIQKERNRIHSIKTDTTKQWIRFYSSLYKTQTGKRDIYIWSFFIPCPANEINS
jgi:hypothetical protein